MYSFLMNPWATPGYYVTDPNATEAASPASPQQAQYLTDLFAIFNHPQFRQGMAYNYGQSTAGTMGGAFAQATKDKLDYARTLAGSRAQVTTGGSVPPAQLQAWDPRTIMQLIALLGPRG